MTREDEIDYAGPGLDVNPSPGGNRSPTIFSFLTPRQRSYADINALRKKLDELITYLQSFENRLESDLRDHAMVVAPSDTRLTTAVREEWPKSLELVGDQVSYRYYKALKGRTTTASDYITQKFEEAARDIVGNDALDILSLVRVSLDEANLVTEFLDTYINDVDDPSEYRILELFQDWAENALRHTGNLGSIYTSTGQNGVDGSEMDQIGPTAARDAQAILKIKMNDLSVQWVKERDSLQKNFAQYAPTFYGRYLGPALRFRLAIGRKLLPKEGSIGAEITATVDATNSTLQQMLTDQVRRNSFFDEKLNTMSAMLTTRNWNRAVLAQLEVKTGPVAQTNAGTIIQANDSPEVIDYFENEIFDQQYTSSATPELKAQHRSLAGIEADDAHSQYLLLKGGTLTGDLALATGVKVDGIIPHRHAHTGEDGSSRVSGLNIVDGTIPASVIDPGDAPDAPTTLRMKSTSLRVVPPGMTVVDVDISWQAEADLQFEVQYTRVL